MIEGTFGGGLEDYRNIVRLSSRQSALHHPTFLVGPERGAGVTEHEHRQRRLSCEVGGNPLGLGGRYLL
jgi:hypothetical protein